MSDHTKIEWTDATWNVIIGCDKVSPGCDHCYAIRTAHRMQANPDPKVSEPYAGTEIDGEWTGRVNVVDSRLGMPLRWRKPRRIFVNAQSDLFHDAVPDGYIARVFAVMALAPQHTFQILTKRHGRMRSLLSSPDFHHAVDEAWMVAPGPEGYGDMGYPSEYWPLPNVWLGVSTEDQKWADIRIPALLDTPAAVRFISAEPLLGPIDLHGQLDDSGQHRPMPSYWLTGQPGFNVADGHLEIGPSLDWVIVGGESGPGARPMHPDWARNLRDQCTQAGVAFHFKQWGEWVPESMNLHGAQAKAAFLNVNGVTRPLIDGKPAAPPMSRGDAMTVRRVGKKAAGRLLNGRTWDEYPAVTS